jgi:hypothetical protein
MRILEHLPVPSFALAALFAVACGTREPEPQVTAVTSSPTTGPTAEATAPTPTTSARVTSPQPQQSITIQKSTQATVGDDLRIGAGNSREEDVSTEGKPAHKELTAGLWFYVKSDSSQDKSIRVHVGQEVTIAGYRLEVVAIDKDVVRVLVGKAR